jgi:hypothetical protein
MYPESSANDAKMEIHINKKVSARFIQQIKRAETFAQK